jgi:hypothetical protein
LLTVEQFEHIDRRQAEQILKDPRSIFSVDPRFFEELVASIYADLGYRVILTKRTRDGGRNIICLAKKDGFDLKYIIECKRYAAHRKISVGQIPITLWRQTRRAGHQGPSCDHLHVYRLRARVRQAPYLGTSTY